MKKLNFMRKILFVSVIMFSALFGSTFLLALNQAKAETSYYGTNTVSVTNGNFTSYSKETNGLPYSLTSGWTVDENSTSNVNSGVIDVGETNFNNKTNNKFGLSVNPETDKNNINADNLDDYILMIKANGKNAEYAYKSDELSLSANKFYVISVHCKTGLKNNEILEEDAFATISTNLSDEKFFDISTNGLWKEYNFFVATDTFSDSSLVITLKLQKTSGTGVIFFDQVSIIEVAENDFYNVTKDNKKTINLDNDYVTCFENSNFEDGLNGFETSKTNNAKVLTSQSINNLVASKFSISGTSLSTNYLKDNQNSLLLINENDNYVSVKSSETNNISILQHGFYLLEFYYKTGNISNGGLSATLSQVTETDSEEAITCAQTSLTSSTNAANNDFAKASFYIRGSAWQNEEINIEFALGTESNQISGWAIIDGIKIQKINSDEFSKATDSNKLDLSSNITDTETISNGSFNFVSSTNSTITYPALPENWTGSSNSNLSGIIRVNSTLFNQDRTTYNYNLTENPGPNDSYSSFSGIDINASTTKENVLMVRNKTNEDVYFKSSSFTVSSNSQSSLTTIKLEVGVKTFGTSKAFIKVVDSNDNILALIDQISATNWTTYSIYLTNGISSKDVSFVLGTHGDGNDNHAFFDYVKYNSSVSDFTLAKAKELNNATYVNILENTFYSASNEKIKSNVYKTYQFDAYSQNENNKNAVYFGIVDGSANDSIKTIEDAEDNNVLVISNPVSSYQIISSNYTCELNEDSYYEFSVYIKTILTDENEENCGAMFEVVTLDDDGNITINESNTNKFSNIKTSSTENNGWVKYSIYVLAEETQKVKVLLGLGQEENDTRGQAYFDNLSMKIISSSDYSSKTANDTTIISKVVSTTEETNESEDEKSSTSEEQSINIWALFSSIILIIAMALAIAGYLIRRIPKKAVKAENTDNYVISPKTINSKDVKFELQTKRKIKLQDLEESIEKLNNQKATLQKEYDEQQQTQDEDKNALYISFTKKLNKLNKQIDYLSSAVTYLKDNSNIKSEEHREIKRKKKEVENEFLKLKLQDNSPKKKQKKERKKSKYEE